VCAQQYEREEGSPSDAALLEELLRRLPQFVRQMAGRKIV
jgi:hypothetical protein